MSANHNGNGNSPPPKVLLDPKEGYIISSEAPQLFCPTTAPSGEQYMTVSIVPIPRPQESTCYLVRRFSTLIEDEDNFIDLQFDPVSLKTINENIAVNLQFAKNGITEFFGKHKDKTVFIVGSGRSIAYQIETIRKIPKDECVVIAINGAFKFFKTFGMLDLVDYYFLIDRACKREWWEGADLSNVKVICSLMTPPSIIEDFKNRYYYCGSKSPSSKDVHRKMKHLGILDSARLASYSAMHLAYKMGAKRMCFLGHDFAFSHCYYQWDEEMTSEKGRAEQAMGCDSINGKASMTSHRLKLNCDCIYGQSIFCEMDGIEVWNCSEMGILNLMQGARNVSLMGMLRMIEDERENPDIMRDLRLRVAPYALEGVHCG